ncbi:MAG: hypothetical protein JXO22_06735, partial [Phycisphaerae bacterium]|nr:hypothetical protein [Phycisphaerae bacterium]
VVLLLAVLLPLAVQSEGDPIVSKPEWRIALLCAIVYVSCAAIRLARYNVENTHDALAKKKFSGLPVPGAAVALVALLVLHEDPEVVGRYATAVRILMLPAAFILGLLMTSRLDYVHVFNMYVRRRHPPIHLVWLVVIIGIGWHSPPLLLVVLAYAYVFSGLLLNLRRDHGRHAPADANEHAA